MRNTCVEGEPRSPFTVPNDGAIGPEPHPNFIDLFSAPAVGGGSREVERAGEDGQEGRAPAQLEGSTHRGLFAWL